MEDALATLKRTGKSARGALYDLPWYLIIGPPGAGKTTALVNSGLKFPLAGDSAAQGGPGRRRHALLRLVVHRPGRADRHRRALHDAGLRRQGRPQELARLPRDAAAEPAAPADQRRHRRDQHRRRRSTCRPTEVDAHADAIRKRLNELHEELKIDFPVYAVFTKMDLVAGFTQYFADLDEARRQAVWGATFQTARQEGATTSARSRRRWISSSSASPSGCPNGCRTSRICARARSCSASPRNSARLRKPVADFLNRIFEPTRYQTTATLRGFYFTSGTQEGTPFDAVIGALQKSYGVESFGAAALFRARARAIFLHDLMAKVIFARGRLGLDQCRRGAPRVRRCAPRPSPLIGACDRSACSASGG